MHVVIVAGCVRLHHGQLIGPHVALVGELRIAGPLWHTKVCLVEHDELGSEIVLLVRRLTMLLGHEVVHRRKDNLILRTLFNACCIFFWLHILDLDTKVRKIDLAVLIRTQGLVFIVPLRPSFRIVLW